MIVCKEEMGSQKLELQLLGSYVATSSGTGDGTYQIPISPDFRQEGD